MEIVEKTIKYPIIRERELVLEELECELGECYENYEFDNEYNSSYIVNQDSEVITLSRLNNDTSQPSELVLRITRTFDDHYTVEAEESDPVVERFFKRLMFYEKTMGNFYQTIENYLQ